MTDQAPDDKNPRFRSPAYPSISLSKAVDRIIALYPKSLHHSVPVSVLAAAWGYGVKSSGLFATLAALKQFGLLTDEGSGDKRRFKLTDSAMRIARDPDPNSEKRIAAIRTAALAPKIHSELWGQYGVPGASGAMDVAVKSYLTLDRADSGSAAYSDTAADELIEEYRQTMTFAGLLESPGVSLEQEEPQDTGNLVDPRDKPNVENTPQQQRERQKPPADRQPEFKLMGGEREIMSGLLSKSAKFRLVVTGEIGAKEIDLLIRKLNLEKEVFELEKQFVETDGDKLAENWSGNDN